VSSQIWHSKKPAACALRCGDECRNGNSRADAARLQRAINALPAEFCEILVLRDIQGLHYQEIAEVAGVPIGTVMSRLARARRRVTETLRADD
jgi:RNA polymerase sigma factor (sigma-70 family)